MAVLKMMSAAPDNTDAVTRNAEHSRADRETMLTETGETLQFCSYQHPVRAAAGPPPIVEGKR